MQSEHYILIWKEWGGRGGQRHNEKKRLNRQWTVDIDHKLDRPHTDNYVCKNSTNLSFCQKFGLGFDSVNIFGLMQQRNRHVKIIGTNKTQNSYNCLVLVPVSWYHPMLGVNWRIGEARRQVDALLKVTAIKTHWLFFFVVVFFFFLGGGLLGVEYMLPNLNTQQIIFNIRTEQPE